MMGDDKSKASKIIAEASQGSSDVAETSDYDMAKEDAAKAILAAIEKKDAKQVASAMQSMVELCMPSGEGDVGEV